MIINQSDEALMKLYLEGEERAFNELFNRYSSKIYGYLVKRVDRSLADELFQEVFLKVHRYREKYDSSFPFSVWIFTICRNLLKDFYKKPKENLISLEDTNEPISYEISENLMDADIPDTVLNSKQKEMIKMRYKEGLTFEEIARSLDSTPQNIRKAISRAVKKLQLHFK